VITNHVSRGTAEEVLRADRRNVILPSSNDDMGFADAVWNAHMELTTGNLTSQVYHDIGLHIQDQLPQWLHVFGICPRLMSDLKGQS